MPLHVPLVHQRYTSRSSLASISQIPNSWPPLPDPDSGLCVEIQSHRVGQFTGTPKFLRLLLYVTALPLFYHLNKKVTQGHTLFDLFWDISPYES